MASILPSNPEEKRKDHNKGQIDLGKRGKGIENNTNNNKKLGRKQ